MICIALLIKNKRKKVIHLTKDKSKEVTIIIIEVIVIVLIEFVVVVTKTMIITIHYFKSIYKVLDLNHGFIHCILSFFAQNTIL